MSILSRYLAREILRALGMTLAALLLLFTFLDLVQEIPDLRPEGYTLSLLLLRILLILPTHLQELLPAATVIGALFAFARLAAASEFTVMRASGLSPGRLVGHLAVLGLAISAFSFALGEFVIPHTERAASQIKVSATTGLVAQQFRTGLWAKDKRSFINIQELLPDANLANMRVYVFDESFRLRTIRHAERASWQADGSWRLENVLETQISQAGTRTASYPALRWQSDVNPDLLAALMVAPEHMSTQALMTYIDHLRENRQKTTRYEIALWNKLSFPLALPVMLLLALPFAYQPPRSGSVSGRVLAGILIGLGFHLANRLTGHLGLLNDWPPAASALAALFLFSLAAGLALWRVEHR